MAHILLAEDDISMRGFLAAALENAGHTVDPRNDGLDALSALTSDSGSTYDLLLADIVMPGMDGIELAQKASELHPNIRVMFITGFAAVALGANGETQDETTTPPQAKVLSKPFHLRDLVDQVNRLLAA